MKVAIRRISLASLGKFGCLLGVVAACLPSLLCGLLGMGLVDVVRNWLEGWQELTISILGQEIVRFDLVNALGLSQLLERLQVIGDASWAAVVLVVLALALVSGLLLAVIVVTAGLAYNLLAAATGGLVVDAAVIHETDRRTSESADQRIGKSARQ
jgi:hypothetical protein